MNTINQLLASLYETKGSDLHLVSQMPPLIRRRGEIIPVMDTAMVSNQDIESLIYPILNKERQIYFDQHHDLDFAYALEGLARFRVNLFHDINGIGAVFRIIPDHIPHPESLHIPNHVLQFSTIKKGLILVTGPTGSGKSTTLACLIDLINQNENRHILTIEDPIEFIHYAKNCRITQREIHVHTPSFEKALRSALRQDPDVILVGEMRDKETIQMALTAAEMGILVFGTLHTNGSYKAIHRIIDVFPSGEKNQIRTMLASSLMGIISQQLIKDVSESGQVPLFETVFITQGIRSTIRDGKTYQIPSLIEATKHPLTQTLKNEIQRIYEQGMISNETFKKLSILYQSAEIEGEFP